MCRGLRAHTALTNRAGQTTTDGPAPDELGARGPARHELVVGGVIPADERDVLEVDSEQAEPAGFRLPPNLGDDDIAEGNDERLLGLRDHRTSDLVFAARPVSAR